jgi:hypothetical protein
MRTSSGRDWQAGVMADTASNGSGAYAPANWMALSSDPADPSDGSVTLPGEEVGGTLDRAQASYAHTTGTATYTLINTFTSDRTVTVYGYGVFTASTGGVLFSHANFDEGVPMKVGDTVQIIDTISL